MARFKKAVGLGYRNIDHLRAELAIEPLRGCDALHLQLLMLDLAFPADPFVVES